MRSASSTAIAALAMRRSGLGLHSRRAARRSTMQQAARLHAELGPDPRQRAPAPGGQDRRAETLARRLRLPSSSVTGERDRIRGPAAQRLQRICSRVGDLPISVGLQVSPASRGSTSTRSPVATTSISTRTSRSWRRTDDVHLGLHAAPTGDFPPAAGTCSVRDRRPQDQRRRSRRPATCAVIKPLTVKSVDGDRWSGHPPPAPTASRLAVSLHNLSAIPQYQLQVYAFARHRRARYVAAGRLTVERARPRWQRERDLSARPSSEDPIGHARPQIDGVSRRPCNEEAAMDLSDTIRWSEQTAAAS